MTPAEAQAGAERSAHDVILKWCRSNPRGTDHPGMRIHDNERRVVSLTRTEPKPESDWERQPVYYARAATWVECLAQLREKGFHP